MAPSSSTSSSERSLPGGGTPWALLLAVLVVVGVEASVRLVPQDWRLGYGTGSASYLEVNHHIEDFGAAQVSILGSSRGREAIVVPELRAQLERGLGQSLTVSNYSCSGARTDEIELMVRQLVSQEHPPKLALLMVSPRLLLGDDARPERLGIFWTESEWRQHAERQGGRPGRVARWARPWLMKHYLTYRHRLRFRRVMTGLFRGRRYPSPMKGELTEVQRYEPTKSMIDNHVTPSSVARYVARLLEGGAYVFGERRIKALDGAVRLAKEAGLPLVLVEVPLNPMLLAALPADVRPRFLEVISKTARAHDVPFVRLDDMDLNLLPTDYREQSHLNHLGATKFTAALVAKVVLPRLNGG